MKLAPTLSGLPHVPSRWVRWLSLVAVFNFLAFVAASLYLGGDAHNGYVRAGHYVVCAHGRCSEVSAQVWRLNYWHGWTAMGGILLMLTCAAIERNRRPF